MYRKLVFQAWVAIWLASILSGCTNPQENVVTPIFPTENLTSADVPKFPTRTITPVVSPPSLPEDATKLATTETTSHSLYQTPPFLPLAMTAGKSKKEVVADLFNLWLSQFVQEGVESDLHLEEYLVLKTSVRKDLQSCASTLQAEFIAEGLLFLRPTEGYHAQYWVAGGGSFMDDKEWMTKTIYTAVFKTDQGYTWDLIDNPGC